MKQNGSPSRGASMPGTPLVRRGTACMLPSCRGGTMARLI